MHLPRKLSVPAATALAAALIPVAAAAPSASAAAIYTKNGTYQFASNYTDGSATPFVVSNSPFSYGDASQSIGVTEPGPGVNLSVGGGIGGYQSSAVIVPLGHLDALFTNGKFVPPTVAGSPDLQYNLYFDTDGNGTYFGWGSHDPYVYEGMDGDNAACMGAAGSSTDTADFTCFPGQTSSTGGPALSGQMTMEAVQQAFAARTDSGTTNPEVWAWIGIQSTSGATETGYVDSVDGTPLVTQAPAVNPVSGLKATAKYTNLTATWKASTGATGYQVTVTTHQGAVTVAKTTVTSLSHTFGHLKENTSYAVHVLAEPAASGATAATVYVKTK